MLATLANAVVLLVALLGVGVGVFRHLEVVGFGPQVVARQPEHVHRHLAGDEADAHRRRDLQELGGERDALLTGEEKTVHADAGYTGAHKYVKGEQELHIAEKRGKVKADSINEKTLEKYLYSPKMRDVDMFLRSSGEQRTSNFLPWQSTYAELVFMDVLWPDMTPKMLWKAIEIYSARERRFGSA